MCNLYRVRTNASEVAGLFNAEAQPGFAWKDEIYPRYQAPIIREEVGRRLLEPMAWGFPTQVQGARKMLTKHVTNARNLTSQFWKSAAMTPARRCLVPFTQFAEPKSGKDPETGRPAQYWFTVTDQPTACFAGLWRPAEAGAVFAFLTCEPNPLVRPLHEKAMPVILLPENHDQWLRGTYEDVLALQAPYPSQMMTVN